LRVIPGFGVTVAAFGDILPVLLQYATVLLCSMYSFAVLGTDKPPIPPRVAVRAQWVHIIAPIAQE
jgi:hypothetical protein